jgi:hypothetical protein
MFYRVGPSVTEPQPKDEKIFNHKERKDHKKKWRAGFPPALDDVKELARAAKVVKHSSTKFTVVKFPIPNALPETIGTTRTSFCLRGTSSAYSLSILHRKASGFLVDSE